MANSVILDSTISTISDAYEILATARRSIKRDDRERTIHILRQTVELLTNALGDFDADLRTVVSITEAGEAATAADKSRTTSGIDPWFLGPRGQVDQVEVPEEHRTDIDNEVPSRTEVVARPERVTRHDLLKLAESAVGAERQSQYGEPHDNFMLVADMWSAILGTHVTTERVALCQVALKLARLAFNPSHVDSWVDLAGYAAIGAELGTLPVDKTEVA
jgi:hypothetical protein